MSRRAAAATFAGCRSGITRWRNTACGGATLALCQLRCIAPAGARRRSAMWGALVRQGGATLQRHSVQCSGDQRDHGAWRVTRKGGRRIDRPHRASRSCRRDARAPGVRSRHAGATPAHLAPTAVVRARRPRSRHPQSSCGRGRPRIRHTYCTPQPSCGRDARAPAHSRVLSVTRAGRPRSRRPQPSRGRDARAPGTHSRRAGTTPAHLAPTAVVRARRPRSRHAHSHRSRHAGGDARAPAHSRPSQRPE